MNDALQRMLTGDYQGGHALCMEMIRANVNDPRPYHALGILAFDHKNIVKAEELFGRAAGLDPANAAYLAARAQALSLLGRQSDAREAAEAAAKLEIADSLTADTVAVVFSRAGFHERAVPFFEQAIALNPAPANYHYNLGSSLQFAGRFKEAKQAYEAALEREPGMVRAYSGIVSLERQTQDSNLLETLLPLFDRAQDDADASLHLGHAIAKTYEDLGQHDESLAWLSRAKRLNRTHFPVDPSAQQAVFEAARTTAALSAPEPANVSDGAPIFIVGLPRTGTTLVDRILSSHPDVVSAGELNVFASMVKEAATTPSNLVLDAETLLGVRADHLNGFGEAYMAATQPLARGAPRFTDKMPLNFFYGALITKALPNARIVALRRGAMDSCLSNYRQLFSTQFSYYNYTYDLETIADFYRGYDTLMADWRNLLPEDRFMEIRYEDIVFDQETQTRRLLEFCGLSWDERCLRFHENDAPVSTASSVQVRQPLYSGSIGRWQRYSNGLDRLRAALGPLAETD